jgi:hypothetical protein
VLPAPGVLYTDPPSFEQTVTGPLITGVGFAFLVTLYTGVTTEQPVPPIVSVNCIVPTPADPHVTVIELVPAPAVIAPPTTFHTKVLPDAAVLYTTPDWFSHTLFKPVITGVGFALIVTL